MENTEGKPVVTITGITGYVGMHVCKMFLEDGGYSVKGTVRSTKNPAKMEPLKKAFGEHYDSLTFCEADLNDEASMLKAFEGSDYIVHTASPFVMEEPKDEMDLIRPAVNGTMAALKGAKANKVKKLVITSSCVAVWENGGDLKKRHFGPDDWSDTSN